MIAGIFPIAGVRVGLQRLERTLKATRPDVIAIGLMFPVTIILCLLWGVTPSLALGDYVITHALVTGIAMIPAYALSRCAGWLLEKTPQPLKGERARSFLTNLALLLCISWIYSHLKTGIALQTLHDTLLYDLDRWLCGGHEPWELVRQWMPGAGFALHLIYMSFFPVLLAAIYWMTVFGSPQQANRLTCALCVAYLIGVLGYHLLPSFGPFYYCASGSSESVSLSAHRLQELLLYHVRQVQVSADSPISPWKYLGAFPSLHVGHVIVVCWFVRRRRWLLTMASAYLLATMLSTTYLGWHYLLDWVGGAMVAAAAIVITEYAAGRCPSLRLCSPVVNERHNHSGHGGTQKEGTEVPSSTHDESTEFAV